MDGYFLNGTGEYLLVFRSDDREILLSVIKKLQGVRDKSVKELAIRLEQDWYDGK